MVGKIYNFAAGPAQLPAPVLKKAQAELMNWHSSGMSVMEMSHRGSLFQEIHAGAKEKLRSLLSVPSSHDILFMQGGATGQFSAVPLNLMGEGPAVYAVTGNFSGIAAREAAKYGKVLRAFDGGAESYRRIPRQSELKLERGAAYFHYCANNTIYGTAWDYVPEAGVPLVCDMSSEILSHPVEVGRYRLIYAGAQKNMAPAGLTVVIIDRALAGHERAVTPLMMSYQRMIDKDSMYNTPPCYNIYMLGLVLDWLEKQGGVAGMEKRKSAKAKLLYDYLDESALFRGCAERASRSDMNVTFRTGDAGTDAEFVKFSLERGLRNLKGHRVAGGMRASLYNAMPEEGVLRLVETMKEFEAKRHV